MGFVEEQARKAEFKPAQKALLSSFFQLGTFDKKACSWCTVLIKDSGLFGGRINRNEVLARDVSSAFLVSSSNYI